MSNVLFSKLVCNVGFLESQLSLLTKGGEKTGKAVFGSQTRHIAAQKKRYFVYCYFSYHAQISEPEEPPRSPIPIINPMYWENFSSVGVRPSLFRGVSQVKFNELWMSARNDRQQWAQTEKEIKKQVRPFFLCFYFFEN